MTGSYYLPLVLISALVAALASYAALDLSGRVSAARGVGRRIWLLGGSVAMGVGIWSMHFIAMLAFHLPMPIRYNIPFWLASVAIAIVASLLALTVVSRETASWRNLLAAAPLMGLAIAGMHYTGMAAMRVPAEIAYAPALVTLSIAIAVAASFVALLLALHFREGSGLRAGVGKGLSAVVMGLAICGMHYTGMAAVSFHPSMTAWEGTGPELLATRGLAITVTLGSLLILALALVGARIDRQFRGQLAASAETAEAILRAEIDERLNIQERLRESKESYRSLFDSLTELVFVLDLDGRVLDVNDVVERTYGYRRSEIVGRIPFDLIGLAGTTAEELTREFTANVTDEPRQFESWGRSKDGRTVPLEVVVSPAIYFGERAVLAAARDITDRKRAEAEIAAAEAHYRRLVETSPYGIFSCDAEGVFLELNSSAEQIFSPEDVLGRPFASLLDAEDRAVFNEALDGLRDGSRNRFDLELRIRPSLRDHRLLALTLTEVREADSSSVIHGIARDITAERQQQQQLRRAERLAGVGTLIGGVAHELNNPLTAIQSFADLMLLDERVGDDRDALETMRREASRAARIVSDLRLLARGTQDEPGRVREAVDLNDVVRHVVKLRGYVLATHNIEVREDLDPDLPPVLGDRGQLEQVILNLVVNAGQAMEGTRTRRLLLRTRTEDGGILVEVGDSGIGIKPHDLERIFDPFWTTKSPGDGTGLGLSLVHSIITDHSGTIRVQSRPNKGTTFLLVLPRAAEVTASASARVKASPAVRPLRLLLVEDETGIRKVLETYLRRRGHQVDVSSDGAEALELVLADYQNGYDVIVSDLRMPGMSGDRFLERLQALGKGDDRRTMFISGDAADPQTARIIEAAAVPIMYKPFGLEEFSNLVEEFADRAADSGLPSRRPTGKAERLADQGTIPGPAAKTAG